MSRAALGHHGDIFRAALPGGNRGGLSSPASQPAPKVSPPQSEPCLVLVPPDCANTASSIQVGMTPRAHPAARTGELELLAWGLSSSVSRCVYPWPVNY